MNRQRKGESCSLMEPKGELEVLGFVGFVRAAEDVQRSGSQSTETHSPIPKYVEMFKDILTVRNDRQVKPLRQFCLFL